MIHQRPQREEGENLQEGTMLLTQGTAQFRFDAILNDLTELVHKSNLPWGNRMLLLHGIARLRWYVHGHTRRMVAEAQGRIN